MPSPHQMTASSDAESTDHHLSRTKHKLRLFQAWVPLRGYSRNHGEAPWGGFLKTRERRRVMRRALLLAAALAIPMSGASVVALSGTAGAAVKINCTTITGNASSTLVISGCSGGNTGGSSKPVQSTALAAGGTIDWVSGSTTTISAPTLTSTSPKKCPGYVKGGSSNPSADKIAATVTADTGDGLKVPGKATGAVCISSSGAITALKPLKAS
jgi:hypothetical protein